MPRVRSILLVAGPVLVLAVAGLLVVSSRRETARREELRESLREASEMAARFHRNEIAPDPGSLNGADFLMQAAAMASVTGPESTACNEATFFPLSGMNWNQPASPAALAAAARNAPALAMLARGVAEDSCSFPLRRPTAESGPCIPQARFLLLAQLLEVRGRGEIQAGDLSSALDTLRLLGQFANRQEIFDPSAFSTRVSILHHQASLGERLATNPALDGPTARSLLEEFTDPRSLDGLFLLVNRSFREPQIKDLAFQVLAPGGRKRILEPGTWQPYEWTSHDPWRAMHGPGERVSWFPRRSPRDPEAAEVEELLSTWKEFNAAWELPGAESSRAESKILARLLGGEHTVAADALWASVYPRTFVLNLEGRVECLRTLLTLKAGWLETGRVPTEIPNPPLDPWDGNPVRWRIDPTEWVVWVVGIDGRDDGGMTGDEKDDRALRCHIAAPTGR